MKTNPLRFIKAVSVIVATLLAACGNDNARQRNANNIQPAEFFSSVTIQPDGTLVIPFSGTGQAVSSLRVLAGQFPNTTGNCGNNGTYACFQNRIGGRTVQENWILGRSFGALTVGSMAVFGSSTQRPERFYFPRDNKTSISLSIGTSSGGAVPLSGVITLSPQFVANELGGNRQIIAVGMDLSIASGFLGGQAYLLTSPNNGSFIVF